MLILHFSIVKWFLYNWSRALTYYLLILHNLAVREVMVTWQYHLLRVILTGKYHFSGGKVILKNDSLSYKKIAFFDMLKALYIYLTIERGSCWTVATSLFRCLTPASTWPTQFVVFKHPLAASLWPVLGRSE